MREEQGAATVSTPDCTYRIGCALLPKKVSIDREVGSREGVGLCECVECASCCVGCQVGSSAVACDGVKGALDVWLVMSMMGCN